MLILWTACAQRTKKSQRTQDDAGKIQLDCMAVAGNPRLIHINPQGYPHKSQAVGEKSVVNIRLFWRKAQKNGRFIAESSALVGRVCQPKNEIPCSRSGKFRKCVGRIQFQMSNKFCPMKRMIGRVSSEMFIESSTEETKCRSLCMEGSGRGEEEISPRHPPVRHH